MAANPDLHLGGQHWKVIPWESLCKHEGLREQFTPSDRARCLLGEIPQENNHLWEFAAVLGLASDTGLLVGQELAKWTMVAGHKSSSWALAVQLFFWF